MIWPSVDAESTVLKDRETASTVTGERWPKRHALGCRSTDLAVELYVQMDIVQSMPEVINVWESAKIAQES